MAVGKGFLDQYSVFCVFGSVVGCVVVPLITQSIESVIFSAIVISLTATHLSKRAVTTDTSNKLHPQPHTKDNSLRKSKEGNSSKKKSPKKAVAQGETHFRTSDYRQRKEEKIRRIEEAKKLEEQRKQEEKRERKAKKKEEKLKQKEEEKKIHEEEVRRRKIKEEKSEKQTSPVIERAKSKSKPHGNAGQKGTWITPSNSRTSRKSSVTPVTVNDSVVTPLDSISPGDALYREKASASPDLSDSKPPSPPPSVWKVPEYVPPRWNPDKHSDSLKDSQGGHFRLNNDVVLEQRKRPSTPFNQLRNPVVSSQPVKLKNQYMNQHVAKSTRSLKESDPNLLADVPLKFSEKPDNRAQAAASPYSNITGLPSFFKSSTETNGRDAPQKTYSLFGPEEPNRVLFQPIFQNNIHVS